jgi:hypothetical protein
VRSAWQLLTAAVALQGIENFKKEFEQLRRAFRYDEFETVTNANPPSGAIQKVSYCTVHPTVCMLGLLQQAWCVCR